MVIHAVDAERDGVAGLGVAAHRTGDGHRACSLGGVDDVICRDGVHGDRSGCGGVHRVPVVCRSSRRIACGVGRCHAGVHRAARYQVGAGHVDAVAGAVGGHHAVVVDSVDRQGHCVSGLGVAAHRAGDGHRACGFSGIDDVVGRDGVHGDARCCGQVHRVAMHRARRGRVAVDVGGADAGFDAVARREIGAWNADAVAVVGGHGSVIGVGSHADRDRVAGLGIARHAAGDGDIAGGFGRVQDVVGSDAAHADAGAGGDVHRVGVVVADGDAVAIRVAGGDAGAHRTAVRQHAAGNAGAEGQACQHGRGVAVAADAQRHGVTHLGVATDRAGDGHVPCGFCGIDDVVGGDGVHRDRGAGAGVHRVGVRGAGAAGIAQGVAGGDAHADALACVGRQVGTGHVDAEAAVGGHRAGVDHAVHAHRDGVAGLRVAADAAGDRHRACAFSRIDDVVRGDRVHRDRGFDGGRGAAAASAAVGGNLLLRGRGKAVAVGQRAHALGDAQQLHKADAAVAAAACAQAGRSGFELLAQVGAALQRLDHGVGRQRGRAERAVHGGRPMLGLGHVLVQPHALRGRYGQHAAVFHHQLDPGFAHGADDFALVQVVTDLERAAVALGIDGEDVAIAMNGKDGGEFGHGGLR